MQRDSLSFLTELLETPSVSGFEQGIQRVVEKRMKRFSDEISVDVHGNLTAAINPDGALRVMLAGHCDQIGMMITHIDELGFLYFNQVGGLDPSVLPGSNVTIHTAGGDIPGVIGHTPVHLVPPGERGKKIEMRSLWIDVGAASGEEVRKKVAVGDPVTYRLGMTRLGANVISSVGCDNRVGLFVVMEALRMLRQEQKKKKKLKSVAVFAVSTVQEELGLRGAQTSCYGIDPHAGIAVDVTHASDNPGADPKEVGTVALGAGPTIARGPNINPVLGEMLQSSARKGRIPFQPLGAPRATGTDANAIQVTRDGVAAALIGIPNRYMHTQVELVDLRDIENAAKLITKTVLSMSGSSSFIP